MRIFTGFFKGVNRPRLFVYTKIVCFWFKKNNLRTLQRTKVMKQYCFYSDLTQIFEREVCERRNILKCAVDFYVKVRVSLELEL